MINYLKSILPRIQQHSKMLDDTATFADIPWAFMDDDGHKVTYIFRRNNELLVSKQGEVVTGKWEYLSVMQSLLIEHEGRKRMYNQGFLNEAIMLLKKDGTDEIFPLGNLQKLPDLEIDKYITTRLLKQIEVASEDIKDEPINRFNLKDGNAIVIHKARVDGNFLDLDNKVEVVNIDGNFDGLTDGYYEAKEGFGINIKNQKIISAYSWQVQMTKQGERLSIRCKFTYLRDGKVNLISPPSNGDLVIKIDLFKDGWIKLKNDDQLKIQNGQITGTLSSLEFYSLIFALIVFLSLILGIIATSLS